MIDMMNTLLSLAAFQAILFLSFLHLVKKKNSMKDLMLSGLLFLNIVLFFLKFFLADQDEFRIWAIMLIFEILVVATIPVVFLKYINLGSPAPRKKYLTVLYLLPFSTLIPLTVLLLYAEDKVVTDFNQFRRLTYLLQSLLIVLYAVIPGITFKSLISKGKANYNNMIQISFLFGSFGMFLFSYNLFYDTLEKTVFFQWLFKISIAGPLVLMFFFHYQISEMLSGLGISSKTSLGKKSDIKYENSSITNSLYFEMKAKLSEMMEVEKPFLKNDLQLKDIANLLDMSVHHTSQLINEAHGENYYSFINKYRVFYAIKLMKSVKNSELNVSDIAYESGFNNKVSFYKSFKRITGLTPTEYMRAI